mgnify:CR=1 FL=1
MAKKDIKFTLDTIDSRYSPVGTVKQLDSVFFYIKITENGVTKDLTGQTIKLFAIKEDKKIVEQTTKINITNQSEGLVEIELLNAAIQVHGFTYFELEISDSNGIISTADFILRVNKRVGSPEAIESTNEVSTLKEIEVYVAQAKQEIKEFKKLQDKMLKTNETININEESRIEAENSRVKADEERNEKIAEFENQVVKNINRLNDIDKTGYIIKDGIEIGNPRYINSWEIGKGWGTIFKPDSETILKIAIRKSDSLNTVDTSVVLRLVECSNVEVQGYNDGILLEEVSISADDWNNKVTTDDDYIITLSKTYNVNKSKYYAVTIFNNNKINVCQVGYDANAETEEESGGFKTGSFVKGIWTNDLTNASYSVISSNTYGLYFRILGENYSKELRINETQVPDILNKIINLENKKIELNDISFLNHNLIEIGNFIDTGERSIQYENFKGWTTVIKGVNFQVNKLVINKLKKININSDVTIKLFEGISENSWKTENPIFQKTFLTNEFNSISEGEIIIDLGKIINCDINKYYALQIFSDNLKYGLAQSGFDLAGEDGISKYFVNGYYYNGAEWNIISKKYGLYFKMLGVDYEKLAQIKYEQVENLKEEYRKLEDRINILELTPKIEEKENYIDIFKDDFTSKESYWDDFSSKWNVENNELIPTAKGDITTNNIRLKKPYHGDKRIMRFDVTLYNDTVFDIIMERNNNNKGEGESCYRIDITSNKLIMFSSGSNGRGVLIGTEAISKSIDFSIIDGNKYLIEIEKNDFTFFFRIKDYLTGNVDEISLKGWGAGRQHHYYGFSWISGENAPKVSNMRISMINNPTCVFVGDSITEGVGMSSIDIHNPNNFYNRYSEVLRNKIGKCLISAMGGDTIGTIYYKFDSEYCKIKPKFICITIGTNGGTTSNSLDQFKSIIDRSFAIGSKLIINFVPCGYSGNYLGVNEQLNTLKNDPDYKDKFILGCRFDLATALDYYPIVDDEHQTTIEGQMTRVRRDLMVDDTHPNHLGSLEMAKRFKVDIPDIFNIN